MSSDAVARAREFFRKADALHVKGHLLRAAENFGRAAEAARAFDSGPDNLVALEMQRLQAHELLNYVLAVDDATADAGVVAAHRAECVALLSAAVAALERRRAAGSLLEGKCTAAEEAWDAVDLREAGAPAADAASLAKLVGYGFFLGAALAILCLLDNAWYFASECSATQFQAFAEHVVHAADLLQLPRSHGTTDFGAEVLFAQKLSTVLADWRADNLSERGLAVPLVQLLTAAWERLQRSSVLEMRRLLSEDRRLEINTYRDKSQAAVDAAMAAPGLRTCALAGCGAKEAHPQHFKSCSACRTVVYCCREHQVEGWPTHKKACKAATAASAEGAGPGAAS